LLNWELSIPGVYDSIKIFPIIADQEIRVYKTGLWLGAGTAELDKKTEHYNGSVSIIMR
jgi:hypothetical protein